MLASPRDRIWQVSVAERDVDSGRPEIGAPPREAEQALVLGTAETTNCRGGQSAIVRRDSDVGGLRNRVDDVEEALALVAGLVVRVRPLALHDPNAQPEVDRPLRVGEAPPPAARKRAPEARTGERLEELPARIGFVQAGRVEVHCEAELLGDPEDRRDPARRVPERGRLDREVCVEAPFGEALERDERDRLDQTGRVAGPVPVAERDWTADRSRGLERVVQARTCELRASGPIDNSAYSAPLALSQASRNERPRSAEAGRVRVEGDAAPSLLGPEARPVLSHAEQLDRLEPALRSPAGGFEHEQRPRRAACEALVVADLEQPEPSRVLDGELNCRRLVADPQPRDPEGLLGRRQRPVLVEEAPPPRILGQRCSADALPPGSFDGDDLVEEWPDLARGWREDFDGYAAELLGASPSAPDVAAPARVEPILDGGRGEVEHRRLPRLAAEDEAASPKRAAKRLLARAVRPRAVH